MAYCEWKYWRYFVAGTEMHGTAEDDELHKDRFSENMVECLINETLMGAVGP